MKIDSFIEKMSTHTLAIYKNEMEQVSENGKIINWLLGLTGSALLFSFNKYDTIDPNDLTVIMIQAFIFFAIIVSGLLHRIKTKAFNEDTISIMRMFDFLKIEFELFPDEIQKELKTETLDSIFDNYLNGEYFNESDKETFLEISKSQEFNSKSTKMLTGLSLILMTLQFACFLIVILMT